MDLRFLVQKCRIGSEQVIGMVALRDALLVVDMQVALFEDGSRYDAAGLVHRLNNLSRRVRASGGQVIFVRHTEQVGAFQPGGPGWQLLPELEVVEQDTIINKSTCDCFAATELASILPVGATRRLVVGGCATEFCVDTTVRSAAVHGYDVWAPQDGHTTADREHLTAEQVIQHHNFVWSNFIGSRGAINITPAAEIFCD